MSIDFSSLIVTADTNEKDLERVGKIQKFIESNYGYFERAALKECSTRPESLDYLFEGDFQGKPIDLAVEYKTLEDFAGSWQLLEDRLARAVLAHDHVALIIEQGTPELTDLETTTCRFINPAVKDGSANVLNLSVFQAKIEEWMTQGVHVRVIQNKTQLTTTILNLLYFVTKEQHGGLWLKETDFKSSFINWLAYMPIKGIGFSVAKKLAERFPNINWMASYDVHDIQDCVGNVTGKKIFDFLHNRTPGFSEIVQDSKVDEKPTKSISKEKKPAISQIQSLTGEIKKDVQFLDDHKPEYQKPIKPKSLEEVVVDAVKSSLHPYNTDECLRLIMIETGLKMQTAHIKMKSLLKESNQLHLSNNIITFCGVQEQKEMDIGV